MLNDKHKNILYEITKVYHKSRSEALELLLCLEDETRNSHDKNREYFYLSLGKLSDYYNRYNKKHNNWMHTR